MHKRNIGITVSLSRRSRHSHTDQDNQKRRVAEAFLQILIRPPSSKKPLAFIRWRIASLWKRCGPVQYNRHVISRLSVG
jgi:hypothetical protein